MCGLSCREATKLLVQGSNPRLLHWQADSYSLDLPGSSAGKESAMQETPVCSLDWEDPLEKK